jgi:hypothetical protein
MIFRNRLRLFFLLALLPGAGARADQLIDQVRALLVQTHADLEFIRTVGLHAFDEGRILIIESAADDVVKAIDGNWPFMKLVNLCQPLVVKFTYSKDFFQFIDTPATHSALADVQKNLEDFKDKMGTDEPYKVLKANLLQMRSVIQQNVLDPKTASHFTDLRVLMGDAVAKADLGDLNEDARKETREIVNDVKQDYPAIQAVDSTVARNLCLELLGLNEFLNSVLGPATRPARP